MSEEEKKAIERIKRQQDTTHEWRKNRIWYDINIALNLIKKQQEKIERLEKQIKRKEQYEDYYESLCKRQQEKLKELQKY